MTTKAQFPLSVVIGAVDRVSAPMHRARRNIQRIFLPLQRVQKSLRGLAVSSGLREVSSQVGTVLQRTQGLASAVGGLTRRLTFMTAAAGAAFGALLHSFTQAGDRILSTSKRLGVSVEWLQEMEYAAERSGASVDSLQSGLGKLSRNIAEAAAGLGVSGTAFDALGVSVRNSDGSLRQAEDVFDDVTRGLAALESQELRNALASRIFGRAGLDLMPFLGQGADEIARLRARARELGAVMSEDAVVGAEALGDSMADLRSAGSGLVRTFLSAITPALLDLTNRLTTLVVEWGPKVREWSKRFAEKLPERLATLRDRLGEVWAKLHQILAPVKALSDRFGAANVAAGAIALVLGGPLLLAVASLSFALVKLGVLLAMVIARIWVATGAGARLNLVLNATMAAVARLIPVIANFVGFALGRMIGVVRSLAVTIWTRLLPALGAWTRMILANPLVRWVVVIGAVISAIARLAGKFDWLVDKITAGLKWLTGWVPDWIKNLFSGKDTKIEVDGVSVDDASEDRAARQLETGRAFGRQMSGGMFIPPKPASSTQTNNAHVTIDLRAPSGAEPKVGLKADRGMDLDLRTGVLHAAAG